MKSKGFTLIELLVVISIIGLLSSIVVTSVNSARIKARDTRRITDLTTIKKALEMYYIDHRAYPPSPCGYNCYGNYYYSANSTWNTLANVLSPYLSQLPVDPINNSIHPWTDGNYSYAYGNVVSGSTNDYDLTTQLEDKNNPNRCEIKGYRWYNNTRYWCPPFATSGTLYSRQIYEASPQ